MRLTLRTLLAYRDGVLNPVDREDLHRRIQQNEVASHLLRRIERVSRELQGASVIVGKGPAADPNTLAAYLDDSLPKEQVAELERVILASDHYLGELAQCHRLLATALNRPVRVPPSLRALAKKIGELESREAIKQELRAHRQAWGQSEVLQAMVRADGPHGPAGREKVPDGEEARPGEESGSPVIVDGVELVSSTGAQDAAGAAPGAQQPDSESREQNAVSGESEPHELVQVQAPMMASAGESIREEGLDLESETLFREVPDYLRDEPRVAWRMPVAIAVLAVVLAMLVWQAIGPWERVRELLAGNAAGTVSPNAIVEGSDPGKSAAGAAATEGGSAAAVESVGEERESAAPSASPVAGPQDAAGQEQAGEEPSVAPATEDQGGSDAGSAVDSPATPPNDGAAGGPSVEHGQVQGMVWAPSDEQEGLSVVLARAVDGQWRPVEQGGMIALGEAWVVPPNNRTTLRLPSGGEWTVGGATHARLVQDAVPHVEVRLGRALVKGNADGERLVIATSTGRFDVEFAGRDSILALDVGFRRKAPGSVLDQAVFPPVVTLVAAQGRVRVTPSFADGTSAAEVELGLGEGLAVVGMERPRRFKLARIPEWYRQSFARPIDRLGAVDLALELKAPVAEPLEFMERLRQIGQNRRPEAAAAGVQTSLMLGDFEPMVRVLLSDSRFSAHWFATLELAQQVLAADPSAATAVQELFAQEFDEKGEVAYEAFLGDVAESPAQTLTALAALLDDVQLGVRIVAAFALRQLTGRDFGYQPHFPDRQSILAVRRELASGRVQVRDQFDVLWEQQP